ncbi:MAG: SusC/RagA family TonB-linked outer membrane protein [Gemmatimonadota bacterium]|nr:SusC/RagA family TonB-linked outer membrane protein [Gemmatimonadota bacterium]
MPVSRISSLLGATTATAFAFIFAGSLSAQAVITGRVTGEEGTPLGGATVTVANTSLGTVTAENGTYRLTVSEDAARGQQATLVARRIGFRPGSRAVTLSGTQEQDFVLAADPLRLEEVVVTGVGEATARNKLTFAVGTVDEQQLQAVPGRSAVEAIQGKVAGARLVPSSSQPGGEVAIRLRGATSIGGRQDPIIIVDGVITRFGLADISPEDIERVEVIKGAAASSLYGSNAANGVVQVFTKRGRSLPEGTLRVTARTEAGINQMPSEMEFSRSHAWQVDSVTGEYIRNPQGARIIESDQIADNRFPTYLNHWDEVVEGGTYATQYLSVGQRRGTTNFNASAQNTRNQGVIFGLGGYTRRNFRLNLDQQVRSNVDASFSTFYGTSTNGRTEEGQGGPFFGLMFVQPDVDIVAACPDTGSAAAFAGTAYCPVVPLSGDVANDFNPLYELANRKITQDRSRFSGSGRVRWRLLDWLTTEGSLGYDSEAESFSDIIPFGYVTSSGTKDDGRLIKQSSNNWQYNSGVTLTSVRALFGDITNTTKVGTTYEKQLNRILRPTADKLVVERVPEFGGVDPSSIRATSLEEPYQTHNYLAITTFDIKDRYIIDALVRRDGSSLFGPEERWANYYRISGAWRVTEDVRIPGLDELRLRASQGTAGLRPGFNYQYEILDVTPGGFSKSILGNPFLKPAHSTEVELGTNLAFGGHRYTFEYTFAKKETIDQILLVDLPAVAGFQAQWQNTGALESKTHEVAFGARLIDRPGASLLLNIVGDRTRQVITDWSLPERLYSFQQMPSAFFLGRGSDLGVMHGNRWVRNIEELYDDPAKNAASGPGQAWDRDNLIINEDGYVVLKSAYGTLNERAIKYVRCKREDASGTCLETTNIVRIGDSNPDFNLSFNPVLTLGRVSLSGLLDWSHGGDLYNGTRQWAFQATRDRAQDQFGKAQNAEACGTAQDNPTLGSCSQKALAYYAVGFYNGLDPNDYFVEDGSYMKLKELGVSYTFAPTRLRRIGFQEMKLGLIGRNLFTITDYSGLDPEVSGLFGDPFQVKMDWFQYPQFRTYSAVVEFSF